MEYIRMFQNVQQQTQVLANVTHNVLSKIIGQKPGIVKYVQPEPDYYEAVIITTEPYVAVKGVGSGTPLFTVEAITINGVSMRVDKDYYFIGEEGDIPAAPNNRYVVRYWLESGDFLLWDSEHSAGNHEIVSLSIPSNTTQIAANALRGCSSLTSITCLATVPPTLGANAFDDTNDCPIYVPAASVEAYKAASGWSTYADRIQAIQ